MKSTKNHDAEKMSFQKFDRRPKRQFPVSLPRCHLSVSYLTVCCCLSVIYLSAVVCAEQTSANVLRLICSCTSLVRYPNNVTFCREIFLQKKEHFKTLSTLFPILTPYPVCLLKITCQIYVNRDMIMFA